MLNKDIVQMLGDKLDMYRSKYMNENQQYFNIVDMLMISLFYKNKDKLYVDKTIAEKFLLNNGYKKFKDGNNQSKNQRIYQRNSYYINFEKEKICYIESVNKTGFVSKALDSIRGCDDDLYNLVFKLKFIVEIKEYTENLTCDYSFSNIISKYPELSSSINTLENRKLNYLIPRGIRGKFSILRKISIDLKINPDYKIYMLVFNNDKIGVCEKPDTRKESILITSDTLDKLRHNDKLFMYKTTPKFNNHYKNIEIEII